MILLDANVFMYAAGVEHPRKEPSVALLQRVAGGDVDAAADAEALQEILHRYRAIGRWQDGRRVFDLARRIVPNVVPVTGDAVDRAREILDAHQEASARDALHAAVFLISGASAICSYDRDFDAIAGVRRMEPNEVAAERPASDEGG